MPSNSSKPSQYDREMDRQRIEISSVQWCMAVRAMQTWLSLRPGGGSGDPHMPHSGRTSRYSLMCNKRRSKADFDDNRLFDKSLCKLA